MSDVVDISTGSAPAIAASSSSSSSALSEPSEEEQHPHLYRSFASLELLTCGWTFRADLSEHENYMVC
jgi:hypothetical protein